MKKITLLLVPAFLFVMGFDWKNYNWEEEITKTGCTIKYSHIYDNFALDTRSNEAYEAGKRQADAAMTQAIQRCVEDFEGSLPNPGRVSGEQAAKNREPYEECLWSVLQERATEQSNLDEISKWNDAEFHLAIARKIRACKVQFPN